MGVKQGGRQGVGWGEVGGRFTFSRADMERGRLESAAMLPGEGCRAHSWSIQMRAWMKGTWEKAARPVQEPTSKRMWMLDPALSERYMSPTACQSKQPV